MLDVKKRMFRFLDNKGTFSRPDYFVPLGHGRRVCMGEPLAKAELAIFFVTIVQVMNIFLLQMFWWQLVCHNCSGNKTFTFYHINTKLLQRLQITSIPGEEADPKNYSMGITRVPNPFKVAVTERKSWKTITIEINIKFIKDQNYDKEFHFPECFAKSN